MASLASLAPAAAVLVPAQAQRLGCGMHMTFYQSTDLTLWFSSWKTTGPLTYAVALLGLFGLAAAQEALAAARAALAKPPPCCRCGAKAKEKEEEEAAAAASRRAGGASDEANGGHGGLEAPLLLSQQENGTAAAPSSPPPPPLPPCCAARAAAASAPPPSSSPAPPHRPKNDDDDDDRQRKHAPTCVARAALSGLLATRCGSALLYAVHAAISYLLMLAAMTYNAGACAAVLSGLAAGHAATRRGAGAPLADACHAPRLEHARTLPLGAVP